MAGISTVRPDLAQRVMKTAEELGYTANVAAHKADTNTESTLIDTAITNKSVAIILDPANADGSVGAVKKAVDAGIPVFLVNAEINQDGLATAQLVSNNAQGAALGAQAWVEAVGDTGQYVELFGNPADNNAATRSNGYETVLTQYPDLVKAAQDIPVAVGFGISTPQQAAQVAAHADGVIVGSAIVKIVAQHGRDAVEPVRVYVRAMKAALAAAEA